MEYVIIVYGVWSLCGGCGNCAEGVGLVLKACSLYGGCGHYKEGVFNLCNRSCLLCGGCVLIIIEHGGCGL